MGNTATTTKTSTIRELLEKMKWQGHYIQKKGTFSYILQDLYDESLEPDNKARRLMVCNKLGQLTAAGQAPLLPIRLSFIDPDTSKVSKSGRGAKARVKQMKANFTGCEESPLKQHKPYKVSTSIWEIEGHKCFFYGTLGITPEEGMPPKDNGDLLAVATSDWKELDVFVFKGMAKPNSVASMEGIVSIMADYLN